MFEIRQSLSIGAPSHFAFALLGLCLASAACRRIGLRLGVILNTQVQRPIADLRRRFALGIPNLFNGTEVAHRDDIGKRFKHARHTDIIPVRRKIDAPDHGRLADLLDDAGRRSYRRFASLGCRRSGQFLGVQ